MFPDYAGGGIYNNHGKLALLNCVLAGNNTGFGGHGGGIYSNGLGSSSALLTLKGCTLSGNTAPGGSGGGIYNGATGTGSAVVNVENCTFSANNASGGGGIFNLGSGAGGNALVAVLNSTFAGNDATTGGAFFNDKENTGTATVTIGNTVLKAGLALNFANDGTITSQGHNISSDHANGSSGTTGPGGYLNGPGDMRNTNPQLDSLGLQNNGGQTQTIGLLSGSPAINAGGDALAPLVDQRGYTRNGVSDIGAFEFNGLPPAPPAATGAVSRKLHNGTPFDITLPLTGSPGVECRSGGASNDYQVVVSFGSAVTYTGASVSSGAGSVSSSSGGGTATVTVNMTGVINAQLITVTLTNVQSGSVSGDVSVPMGVLFGDTNGNGSVNSTDVSQTKLRSGQGVDATNFRTDVNVTNSINATDVSVVKLRVGTALP